MHIYLEGQHGGAGSRSVCREECAYTDASWSPAWRTPEHSGLGLSFTQLEVPQLGLVAVLKMPFMKFHYRQDLQPLQRGSRKYFLSLCFPRLSCHVQYFFSPQAGLLAADRLDSQQYKIKLSCKPLSLSLVCPASDLYIVYCNGPGRPLCSVFLRSLQHVLEFACTPFNTASPGCAPHSRASHLGPFRLI